MAGFDKVLGTSSGVQIPSTAQVKSATDYSGILDQGNALLNRGFENKAVEDFLGEEDAQVSTSEQLTNSIHDSSRDGNKKSALIATSGLKSIAQARKQGLSGSRTQVLANAKLSQALSEFPQHRKALLEAYDNVVDPLGERGVSIFENTADEQARLDVAKRQQELEQEAREGRYASVDAMLNEKSRIRRQAQAQTDQANYLSNKENLQKEPAHNLITNLQKSNTALFGMVGDFVLQQVEAEGEISPQFRKDMSASLFKYTQEQKARIAYFSSGNEAFDEEKATKELADVMTNLNELFDTQDAGELSTQLLKIAKNTSELELWANGGAAVALLNTPGGSNLLNFLNRVTGDSAADKSVKEKLNQVVNSPELVAQLQGLIAGSINFAQIDSNDKGAISLMVTKALSLTPVPEELVQLVNTATDIGTQKGKEIAEGVVPVPPLDVPTVPELASLLDPKTHEWARGQGTEKVATLWNVAMSTVLQQIAGDGEGSSWSINARGNIVGILPSAGRAIPARRFVIQEDMINKVMIPVLGMLPNVINPGQETMQVPTIKKRMVEMFNRAANDPLEDISSPEALAAYAKTETDRLLVERDKQAQRDAEADAPDVLFQDVLGGRVNPDGTPVEEFAEEEEEEELVSTSAVPLPSEEPSDPAGDDLQQIEATPTVKRSANFISSFEGERLEAYQDSAGVWTIGFGSTAGVEKGDVISKERAISLLQEDLSKAEKDMEDLVDVPLSDTQRTAVTSLIFNVGRGAFARSKALKHLNRGNIEGFLEQAFDPEKGFVRAGGVINEGLVRRRNSEKQLFEFGNRVPIAKREPLKLEDGIYQAEDGSVFQISAGNLIEIQSA